MPAVARSVNQMISEAVLVRMVGDEIAELEPDVTPLLVMTTKAPKRKTATHSPRIEKIEDELRQLWGYHNASAIDSVNTQVLVNDGALFFVGAVVAVLKANTSSAVEEIIRVTAISTNTLTVTRNIGGAGADTIAASNAMRIIGSAAAENAGLAAALSTSKTTIISYAQIFKTPFAISNTLRATLVYGKPEEDYQESKAMREHKKEIEAAGLWGRASESLASPGTVWTSMGAKSRISTNVTDAGTTLTMRDFNDFSETAFRYGATSKLFIAAPKVISAINFFSQSDLFTKSQETVYGVQVQELILPHGKLLLAKNWLMESGISGQSGYDDEAYALDVGAIEIRYLAANGVSRDTGIYRDLIKDGTDGMTHAFISQLGWVIAQEKRHARIRNASDYA